MMGFILLNQLIAPRNYIQTLRAVSYNDLEKIIKKYITQNKTFLTLVGPKEAVGFEYN